ncbi:methionine--tRNA ligase [Bacillus sp. AFS015802]|uniref:methionine--tRNA ligase n=1 Tax=Bacillus sp. AFS015802 TaxID=2033486 RepID=UPI000BF99351|nr:methionine--tRNA ligase [Bacillus sp. AFS015802]PFA70746.1 methionine--tRNA ligase [Bacillus sp. AFS015802]
MTVFIGGAWPYANGSLHLGHIAALLPGDIIARYYRMKGENVLYVSGSDCNGTPIGIRASQEGTSVEEVANRYHKEFLACFQALGFHYDEYTRTDHDHHHEEVQRIFTLLYERGWLYEKEVEQVYCMNDRRFLPDRFVEGTCPVCGSKARGDQCDNCSTVLDPTDLLDKSCKLCGQEPILEKTKHLYFALSKLQGRLEQLLNEHSGEWRENAIQLTTRYLKEGLKDRPVTRDLENGVKVPIEGYRDKKIYVWIEAVSGYLSASKKWASEHGYDWTEYWREGTTSYYVHGKDNIPFHTIIWPAVLMGIDEPNLPDYIVSNEYLTLEKRKISTSGNWAVWVKDLLADYHPDTIRYFLTINAPEKRDADFSWREFIYSHNSELLGAFGNLIQRTVKFYEKEFGSCILIENADSTVEGKVKETFRSVGQLIEEGSIRQGLEETFELIRWTNKRFDELKPWVVIKENREEGKRVLEDFLYVIGNLQKIIEPFLPFTASKLAEQISMSRQSGWNQVSLPLKLAISHTSPLFNRIELEKIEEERERLNAKSKEKTKGE